MMPKQPVYRHEFIFYIGITTPLWALSGANPRELICIRKLFFRQITVNTIVLNKYHYI
ncbi:hypothetical protein HMPREF9373_1935 [Psychrobacter sp. 1501(2011)]|nr:hypothetical protein HMPREF9373_1935 [Psychrobacter sp. 1501(2011)]